MKLICISPASMQCVRVVLNPRRGVDMSQGE